MYTTYPLANTADNHTGFLIIFIFSILMCVLLGFIRYSSRKTGDVDISDVVYKCIYTFFVAFVAVSGYNSYTTGIRPKNEPVVAELVKTIETTEPIRVGKRQFTSVPVMFVVYKTAEGEVSFRRAEGVVYADHAILYKN